MEDIRSILKEVGARNGLEIALDENGACTLELEDGRVMLLQERADLNELDFVATLGPVPEEARAEVFTELLSANFYWRETFGATLSWNADLEEVVLIYPLPLADATSESVETIFARFADLQASWAERKDNHDAFKVAARVAVLTNLIGNVPCWNCKSDKDRTGQMDVECKFLATLIARGEPIPEPGARLTKEQQSLLRSIALEGGNFEVQKMNMAIVGFKTGSVNSVTERLGGSEYREFHRGGSDHVNV